MQQFFSLKKPQKNKKPLQIHKQNQRKLCGQKAAQETQEEKWNKVKASQSYRMSV